MELHLLNHLRTSQHPIRHCREPKQRARRIQRSPNCRQHYRWNNKTQHVRQRTDIRLRADRPRLTRPSRHHRRCGYLRVMELIILILSRSFTQQHLKHIIVVSAYRRHLL